MPRDALIMLTGTKTQIRSVINIIEFLNAFADFCKRSKVCFGLIPTWNFSTRTTFSFPERTFLRTVFYKSTTMLSYDLYMELSQGSGCLKCSLILFHERKKNYQLICTKALCCLTDISKMAIETTLTSTDA